MSDIVVAPGVDLLKAMGCSGEELEKAYGKKDLSRLIPVQRQVRGKHGMHTQTVWVKPGEEPTGSKPQPKVKDTEDKPKAGKQGTEEAPAEVKMDNPYTMSYGIKSQRALQESLIGSRQTAKDMGYKEQLNEKNLIQAICVALQAKGKGGILRGYQLVSKTGSGQNFNVQATFEVPGDTVHHTMNVIVPVKAVVEGGNPSVKAQPESKPQPKDGTGVHQDTPDDGDRESRPPVFPAGTSPWGQLSAKEISLPKAEAAKGIDVLSEEGLDYTKHNGLPNLFNIVSNNWQHNHVFLNDGQHHSLAEIRAASEWHSTVSKVTPLEIVSETNINGNPTLKVRYRAQLWVQDSSAIHRKETLEAGKNAGYVTVEGEASVPMPSDYTKAGVEQKKAEEATFQNALREAAERAKADGMASLQKRNEAMANMQFEDETMWQATVTDQSGSTYKLLFPQDEKQAKSSKPRKQQIQDALKKFFPIADGVTVGTEFRHVSKKAAIYDGEADNIDPETGVQRSRNYMNALKQQAASDAAFASYRQRIEDYAAAASRDGVTVTSARDDWERLSNENWVKAPEDALAPDKENYALEYGGYSAKADHLLTNKYRVNMNTLGDYPYRNKWGDRARTTINGVEVRISATDAMTSPDFDTLDEAVTWMKNATDNMHHPNTGDALADGVVSSFVACLQRNADVTTYGEQPYNGKNPDRAMFDYKLPYGMGENGKFSVEMYETWTTKGTAPAPPSSPATEKAIKKWAKDHGFNVTFVTRNTGIAYRRGQPATPDHKARVAVFSNDTLTDYAEASHELERVYGGIAGAQKYISDTQKELAKYGLTMDSSYTDVDAAGESQHFYAPELISKMGQSKLLQQALTDYAKGKQEIPQLHSGLNKGKSASKPASTSTQTTTPKAEAPKAEPVSTASSGTSSGGIEFPSMSAAEAKAHMKSLTGSHSRDDIMSAATAAGITWNKHENPAVNWMRASMAIQKQMSGGAGGTTAPKGNTQTKQPKQPKAEPASTASSGGSTGKIEFAVPDGSTSKAYIQNLVKTHGKDNVIAAAKAAGITWTANDNPGINWMRCSMAINKWMTD